MQNQYKMNSGKKQILQILEIVFCLILVLFKLTKWFVLVNDNNRHFL